MNRLKTFMKWPIPELRSKNMHIIPKENKFEIINQLNNNEIVILLTDTVYGLMAKATKENEIRLNTLKGRNINQKVSIIFPDKSTLYSYLDTLTPEKKSLLEEKLPGKYTFIVNLKSFSNFNRTDFGVRITSNEYLQSIIEETGPLLATSCNLTNQIICTTEEEIIKVFNNYPIYLVKDQQSSNQSSTIIDLRTEITLIRK